MFSDSRMFFIVIAMLAFATPASAQEYLARKKQIDVQKYELSIVLNDSTDRIEGHAKATITFLQTVDEFYLDLTSEDKSGEGMTVSKISEENKEVPFNQDGDRLLIQSPSKQHETKTFTIDYSGIPKDGLVISTNKFGDRTFFGDNWPNRAHNWFPGVDHPSDKAYFTFIVEAPTHYQVIANGLLKEEINLTDEITRYKWETSVPLPTKVAVIAAARFAVQNVQEVNGAEVSTWVYPQNTDEGFHDYQPAAEILNFFIDYIGPYPYQKLANVQSKTRFGGMENAGNIFYYEESVSGKGGVENLLAHEIAHQWFGNSASEIDWPHLWLSEGFATYMTNIYIEHSQGADSLKSQLKKQRERVIRFSTESLTPVVDTITTHYMDLLNANSYQKGGWILHMLRQEIGDEDFHKTIQSYYDRYKLSNASSADFETVAEEVSGQNLDTFFHQWLFESGQPKLETDWTYSNGNLELEITQTQASKTIFNFPLDVQITYGDNSSEIKTLSITKEKEAITLPVKEKPVSLTLDPNVKLLFESADS